ncbi:uncharacterized protein LOC144928135 [Branchiostoma floridae x Branchiostoma belcheri]
MALKTLSLWLLVVCLVKMGVSLKCYSCEQTHDNRLCNTDKWLVDCPQAEMDTCMTTIDYDKSREPWHQKMKIEKTCSVKSACELEQESGLPCWRADMTGDQYACVDCCFEDKCNIGGAAAVVPHTALLWGLVVAVVLGLVTMK